MINQENFTPCSCDAHVNAFIDLNGIPYLLGEYLDKRTFQQVDRSLIRSEINIDQSEAMRAVVDIRIDDIGKRGSDGLPAIVGNNSKIQKLIKMITDNADRFDHQLDVLRRGIVLRVNYQLENQTNQTVIRSMTEDLRITDRSYFLDINPRNVNDNAIIVNFCNSMVSTINEFTHGLDRMVLRITNIQMFYECVKRNPVVPDIHQTVIYNNYTPLQSTYGTEKDMYYYHNQMQHQHYMGYPKEMIYNGYGYETPGAITPPSWTSFNMFYHFDNEGRDVCLHNQEINDNNCKVILLACGTVKVNRAFIINPGHRIIFKFCIWKNDLTVVNDTTPIAQALQIPYIGCPDNDHHHHCNHHCDNNPINPDYETLLRLYRELQCTNDRQNGCINYIMQKIDALSDTVSSLLPPVVDPDPIVPDVPDIDEPVDPIPPDKTPDDSTDPIEPETPTPEEPDSGVENNGSEIDSEPIK